MKIEISPTGCVVIKEIFNGLLLKTEDGETVGICMRDTGFELKYNNEWWEAKNGEIKRLGST